MQEDTEISSIMNLICPAKEGDIVTHETEYGIFTYIVCHVSENMPINFQVCYERKK